MPVDVDSRLIQPVTLTIDCPRYLPVLLFDLRFESGRFTAMISDSQSLFWQYMLYLDINIETVSFRVIIIFKFVAQQGGYNIC